MAKKRWRVSLTSAESLYKRGLYVVVSASTLKGAIRRAKKRNEHFENGEKTDWIEQVEVIEEGYGWMPVYDWLSGSYY